MNNDQKKFFLVVSLIASFAIGVALDRTSMRNQAVIAGAAHWEVTNRGSPLFKWGPK